MNCVKDKRLAVQKIGGRWFLVTPWDHMLHQLNETGAFIWELMEKGVDGRNIAEQTAAEFDVSREQAEQDIRDFIGSLQEKGIVQKDDAEAVS